jgi:hypothetical protein
MKMDWKIHEEPIRAEVWTEYLTIETPYLYRYTTYSSGVLYNLVESYHILE